MFIKQIHIKGFRNFEDETIVFQKKTLIIGANDVGKTNLLYALRLLFDKTISEHDLELSDSDYNAYSEAELVEITVRLCEVTEECLLSIFKGDIKNGEILIRYSKKRGENYKIYTGYDENTLTEKTTRQYIKRINMQYVDTNRDLFSFLRRERIQLLDIAKERLSQAEQDDDQKKVEGIQEELNQINQQVNELKYISSALEDVNQKLTELSIHHEDQTLRFVAGESDADKLLENLSLAYLTDDNPLSIGGDGRKNQIFLATWMAKQNLDKNIDHVTFYAIEEPESHLHPHQQRKLSNYIQNSFEGQILITTHSPHIASKFEAENIVRLYLKNKYTFAACSGCSKMLEKIFSDFSYRLNVLSAEVFFSNGVLLIEGTSEVLFYTALSREIGIDLDRYNISILSVEGVGFKHYIAVCDALRIPWALRTDNDIFPNSHKHIKYFAGVSRVMGIIKELNLASCDLLDHWNMHESENQWGEKVDTPQIAKELNQYIKRKAKEYGCFLAQKDLETDLAKGKLQKTLKDYYEKNRVDTLIKEMQKKKAENMFSFLKKHHGKLNSLKDDEIIEPLRYLVQSIEKGVHPSGN